MWSLDVPYHNGLLGHRGAHIWEHHHVGKALTNGGDVVILLLRVFPIEADVKSVCLVEDSLDELPILARIGHILSLLCELELALHQFLVAQVYQHSGAVQVHKGEHKL